MSFEIVVIIGICAILILQLIIMAEIVSTEQKISNKLKRFSSNSSNRYNTVVRKGR